MYFDLYSTLATTTTESLCKYLASGNHDGSVSVWRADEFELSLESEPLLTSFKAHEDCVNGIRLNILEYLEFHSELFNHLVIFKQAFIHLLVLWRPPAVNEGYIRKQVDLSQMLNMRHHHRRRMRKK